MVNKRTIAILIKLFATKMVAKSRLGFRKRFITRCKAAEGSVSSGSSKDFNCSEKKATSAPEINAEHNSKTTTISDWIQIRLEAEKIVIICGNGSGSKGV